MKLPFGVSTVRDVTGWSYRSTALGYLAVFWLYVWLLIHLWWIVGPTTVLVVAHRIRAARRRRYAAYVARLDRTVDTQTRQINALHARIGLPPLLDLEDQPQPERFVPGGFISPGPGALPANAHRPAGRWVWPDDDQLFVRIALPDGNTEVMTVAEQRRRYLR